MKSSIPSLKIDKSYLIFKTDFKHRNWIDWIKSHIMLGPPPYRFKGSVLFDNKGLSFSGCDSFLKEVAVFNINKNEISQQYYGYDEAFSTFQTRGMGMSYAPIRFTFESTEFEDETYIYLIAQFNGVSSNNDYVFNQLKAWLS